MNRVEKVRRAQAWGYRVEKAAQLYLLRLGWRLLEANFRSRYGEIDIIAADGRCLVFVEVRARQSGALVSASESVGWRKQLRMEKIALYFLAKQNSLVGNGAFTEIRFDVVTQTEVGIFEHIRQAF